MHKYSPQVPEFSKCYFTSILSHTSPLGSPLITLQDHIVSKMGSPFLGLTKHRIQSHQTPALWKGHGIPGPNLQHPQDPQDRLILCVHSFGKLMVKATAKTCAIRLYLKNMYMHTYICTNGFPWTSKDMQTCDTLCSRRKHIYRTWNALHNSFTLQHNGCSIDACVEIHLLAGNGTFKHWDLVKHYYATQRCKYQHMNNCEHLHVIPPEERYSTPQFWNTRSVQPSIFPSLRTEKKHILGICCCSSQHRQESLNADAATARAFENKPWQHLDDPPCPVSFRDKWQTDWYSVHSIVSCE